MKDLRRHSITKVISVLLIGIAGIYMLNYTMFTHRHKTADGRVITHSHPYNTSDSNPFKSHSHSKSELLVLDAFKILLYFSGTLFLFIPAVRTVFFAVIAETVPEKYHLSFRSTRAPPAV